MEYEFVLKIADFGLAEYIEENGKIHLLNLFLFDAKFPWLCFNLTRVIYNWKHKILGNMIGEVGTPGYKAPEVIFLISISTNLKNKIDKTFDC